MSTGDTSQTRLTERKRNVALANFRIYNPNSPIQSPATAGAPSGSINVAAREGILPWVYRTPGGTVSQPNPVASVQPTIPDAPILVSAAGANLSIVLSWIPPPDSGSAITDYRYTTDTGATKTYKTLGTTDTTATITTLSSSSTALVNGTSYTVSIVAINSIGTSIPSASLTAIPAITVPAPPTLVSATAGNQSITLVWTAPTSDGGSAITSYRYTTDGGTTYALLKTGAVPAVTTITTNSAGATLINGTAYTIAIVAVNNIGNSRISNSRTVIPATAPGAPTLDSATAGNQSIILVWTAPGSTGGSPIADYKYSTDGGTNYKSLGTAGTTATITTLSDSSAALQNGTLYSVIIVAVNGFQLTGLASGSQSATPVTAPAAPILNVPTASDGTISLTWTAGSNGGSAITRYEYNTNGSTTYRSLGTTGTTATITTDSVGGNLVNGTAYTITIRAVNGIPLTSVASNPRTVTPATAPGAPTLDSATGGNQFITLAWTAPVSTGGSAIVDYKYSTDGGSNYKSLGTTSPATITTLSESSAALQNGTAYPVIIVAVNGFQITGPASGSRTATPVTAPAAPTLNVPTASDGTISLTWIAGSNGGSAITGYEYNTNGSTTYRSLGTTGTTATITTDSVGGNLVNGTAYTITIRAVNGVPLTSVASNPRTVTPATAPGAPTLDSATAGNQSITLAWAAPVITGGSAIVDYKYSTDNNGVYKSLGTAGTTATITTVSDSSAALQNGTLYSVIIVAVNGFQITGPASGSRTATPVTAPAAPTLNVPTVGDRSISLSWTAGSDGGSAITRYEYNTNGSATYVSLGATGTTATITTDSLGGNLVNGTPYTITIRAVNGVPLTSVASAPQTATPATAPAAPTLNLPTVGDRSISLTWTAGSNGGSAITRYEYNTNGSTTYRSLGTTGTTATITTDSVGGNLVNGTAYTITIRAVNGVPLTSVASNSQTVTPVTAPAAPTLNPATAGNQSITLTWIAGSNGGSAITRYEYNTVGNSTYRSLNTTGTTATITTDSEGVNLVNGTPYTITIRAVNGVPLTSVASGSRTATPVTAPAAPTLNPTTVGDRSITLTWTAGSNGGSAITDYTYNTNGSATFISLNTTGTTATITTDSLGGNLVNGTPYTITIKAVNGVPLTSVASNSQQATPVGSATAPAAPTLNPTTVGDRSITLSWTAGSDGGSAITDYTYNTGGNTTYRSLNTTGTTATITTDSEGGNLVNGTAYTITIKAVNGVPLTSVASNSQQATPVSSATAPGAPTLNSATAGNQSITLAWTPGSTGGSAITRYEYTTDTSGTLTYKELTTTGTATTATITTLSSSNATLQNGTPYTIRIVAVNAVGTGSPSNPETATPATVPSPPRAFYSSKVGNQAITLDWTTPLTNGGSAITDYRYTTDTGISKTYKTLGTTGNRATITTLSSSSAALQNGTSYTVYIVAVNSVGNSDLSSDVSATPVAGVPGAPTLNSATGGNRSITLAWTPGNPGTTATTAYKYTTDTGISKTYLTLNTTGTTATITTTSSNTLQLLDNGTSYTVSIIAVNSSGESVASADITAIPAEPFTGPGAPTLNSATAGDGSITLSWDPPVNAGGSAITEYRYTTDTGANKIYKTLGTTSPATITTVSSSSDLLVNGTFYTISIVAVNTTGNGVPSATRTVAPGAGPSTTPTLNSATGGDRTITLAWTAPALISGSPIVDYTYSTDNGTTYKSLGTTGTTGRITTLSASTDLLSNGTAYTITIRAVDTTIADNPTSNPLTATPAAAPGAPNVNPSTGFIGGNKSILLAWTPPESTGGSPIADYKYSTDGGFTYKSIGLTSPVSITTLSASNTPLSNGTDYAITIVAVNGFQITGPPSPPLDARPVAAPDAPVLLSATAGDQSIALEWTAPISNDGFPIQEYLYSTNNGVNYIALNTSRTTATISVASESTATGTPLSNGTEYTITIVARNFSNLISVASNSRTATPQTPAEPTTEPGVPTLISATAGDSSIVLEWTAPTTPTTGTKITDYKYTTDTGSTKIYKTLSPVSPGTITTVSSSEDPLINGTPYTITIVAVNAIGTGNPSTPLTATPGKPSPPTLVSATAGNQSIILAWTPPTSNGGGGIDYYRYTTDGTNYRPLLSRVITHTSDLTPVALANGTQYNVSIEVINALNYTSNASNTLTSTPVNTIPNGNTMIMTLAVSVNDINNSPIELGLGFIGDQYINIDWGDSGKDSWSSSSPTRPTHTYSMANNYRLTITGRADSFASRFVGSSIIPAITNSSFETVAVVSVASWLDSLRDLNNLFNSQPNNFTVPAYLPENVIILREMFYGAVEFNQPINSWNTGTVTQMNYMFYGATKFNQSLNAWNTAKVIAMDGLFSTASSFDGSLSSWNPSNVTSAIEMFKGATAFNQPLTYNPTTNAWNTSNITSMSVMFNGATSFNQSLASWDTSNTEYMNEMFRGATAFDQNISTWSLKNGLNAEAIFADGPPIANKPQNWPPFTVQQGGANPLTDPGFYKNPPEPPIDEATE